MSQTRRMTRGVRPTIIISLDSPSALATEAWKVEDTCARIAQLLPELNLKVTAPKEVHPERLQAREARYRALWQMADLRNQRMVELTGIQFRSFDESLRDCAESLIAIAGTKVLREANQAV